MQIRKKYGNKVYIIKTEKVNQGGVFGTNFLSKKIYEIQVMIPEENYPYKDSDLKYSHSNILMKRNEFLKQVSKKELEDKSLTNDSNQNNFLKKDTILEDSKNPDNTSNKESKSIIETDLSDIDTLIQSLQKLKEEKLSEILEYEQEKSPENEKKAEVLTPKQNIILEKPTKEEINALLGFNQYNNDKNIQNKEKISEEKKYDESVFFHELNDMDQYFLKIRERLLKSEFSENFTHKFFQILKRKIPDSMEKNPNEFYNFVLKELKNFFYYNPELKPIHNKINTIFFIGPNGSGKTTSLAKISAKYKLENKYDIAIVSLDDYRLAATEQIKTYCGILNIPFYAPLKIDEFKEIYNRENVDFIFVDTPGLSLKDKERLSKLKKFIDSVDIKEVHLVLSATMRYEVIEKYIEFFHLLNYEKIILTGLDEVKFSGFFIELADKIGRPYSFFMNGQDVPEDILEIEAEELIKELIK